MDQMDLEAQGLNCHYAVAGDVQPVDVADAWNLDRYEFNALKYLYRRGNKCGNTKQSDLLKAIWYLTYAITKSKRDTEFVIDVISVMINKGVVNDKNKQ